MKNHIDTVYILGLGAIGGIYAASLFDMDPASVRIIADKERIAVLRDKGINVNGKAYHFDYAEPGENLYPVPDLILVAVKYPQLSQAIQDIKSFIGEDTIVLSLLNGISSEEEIGSKIGIGHLLYTYCVGMDAVREGNNITYKNPGRIVFGEKNNETLSLRVQAVKALFDHAQIPYQISADMTKALWFKFMMDTGINQASAVLRANYGVFQQNEDAQELLLAAAREVMMIAKQLGIALEQTDTDEFMQIIKGLNPTGKTSMLQDMEAGRKSEVDIFAGTVINLGKKLNVLTPVNKTLFNIIRAMESI